ncbi:MAG: CBS domain-containing protein [Bradymonadaceae bacterium]|nr:CBS domain-containing protein [Lujinxingiaceae bacterium]
MNVSEIMTANPACCTPHTELEEVAKLLVSCDCGMLPVIESEETRRPVGAVTDRDIVCRIIALGENPLKKRVVDCMSTPGFTISEHDTLEFAAELMEKHRIRRLIVTDEDGAVSGVVSQADIARHSREKAGELVEQVSQPSGEPSTL